MQAFVVFTTYHQFVAAKGVAVIHMRFVWLARAGVADSAVEMSGEDLRWLAYKHVLSSRLHYVRAAEANAARNVLE